MAHIIVHTMISCAHCMACMHRQVSCPYDFMACLELITCLPFIPAKQHLLEITASHFNTLNMQIANQNMLERILIAIQNKNMAICNENFRIC